MVGQGHGQTAVALADGKGRLVLKTQQMDKQAALKLPTAP